MKKQMRGWLAALVVGVIGGVAQADEAVLPEGYTRIDYIESSGGQYIKAEYTHTRNTKIVCVANVPDMQFGTWSTLFGSRNGSYTKNALEFFATSGKPGTVYGRTGAETTGDNLPYGERVEITVDGATASWRGLDSNLTGSITTTGTLDDGIHSLFIFGMNQSTSARGTAVEASTCVIMKLYSFKIYEGDELKRDFVPCISPAGEPGLFDLVDGGFHNNRGEGRFYVPGEPEMRFGGQTWSQALGKQWFNTGYVPNLSTRIETDMCPAGATEAWSELFGVMNNDSPENAVAVRYYNKESNLNGLFCNNTYGEAKIGVSNNTDMHILLASGVFAVNATTVTVTTVNNPYQSHLNLFCGNNGGSARRYQNVRMYTFKITENGVLQRDYVPMRTADNVVSLYDKVNGTVCQNLGACALACGGSFTYMESLGSLTLFEGLISAVDVAPYATVTKAGPLALKAADVTSFPTLNVQQGVVSFWDGLAKNYTVGGTLTLAGGTRLQLDVIADGADLITAGSIDLSTASAANPVTLAFHDIGTVAFSGTRAIIAGGVTDADLEKFKVVSGVPFTLGVENGALTIAYAGETAPLPAGYTPLAYIKSTGAQYIDTGYLHTPFTTLSCEILIPEQTTASLAAFGAQDSTDSWRSLVFMPLSAGQIEFDSADNPIVGTTTRIYAPLSAFPFGERVTVAYSDGCVTWHGGSLPDGQLRSSVASIGVDGETLYIFDVNSIRAAAGYRGEMLLYGFRIYDGDELVRDFVPCISPRGEVGLYDRAGKTFYGNAGGGRFFTPNETMDMRVEALESTGKQWIDTGYLPTVDTKIEAHLNPSAYSTAWAELFGVMNNDSSANAMTLRYYNNTSKLNGLFCNATYGEAQITITPGTDLFVALEKNKLTVNDQTATITTVNTPYAGSIIVFAGHNGTEIRRHQAMKLYDLTIFENGTPVQAFVPYVRSTGEAGLLDLLDTNPATAFHANLGSVAFSFDPKYSAVDGTVFTVYAGAFAADEVPADCTRVEKAGPLGVSMVGVTSYPALTVADGAFLVDDGVEQAITVSGTMVLGAGVRLGLDVTAAGNDAFTVGALDLAQVTEENPVLLLVNSVGIAELDAPRTLLEGGSLTHADLAKFDLSINLPAALAIENGNLVLVAKDAGQAYWMGGGMTGAWSDPANWLDGVVPEVGSAVTFDTAVNLATTMNLPGLVVGGITFGPNAGAFTTSGSQLTIQEKIVNASEHQQIFNEALSLGVEGSTFSVDTGAQAMTLVGGVGSTAQLIEKKGTGELTIDDTAIAQAGNLDIQAGTVKLNVTETLAAAATPGEIHVAAGARLDVNVDHGSTTDGIRKTEAVHGKTLYLAGDGPDGKGALYNSNPIAHWGETVGTLILTDHASFGGGHLSVRPLANSAEGASRARVEGPYTLTLRNPVQEETTSFVNTSFALDRLELRDSKTQFEGTLDGVITNGIHAYGTSTVNFHGGSMTAEMPLIFEEGSATLTASAATGVGCPVTIQPDATVTMNNGSDITYNVPFVNNGAIVKSGGGILCFAENLTGTGSLESRAGTLAFAHDTTYGETINVTGGTLQFGNAGTTAIPMAIPTFGTLTADVKFAFGTAATIGTEYDEIVARTGAENKTLYVYSANEQADLILRGATWDAYRLVLANSANFGRLIVDEGSTLNVSQQLEVGGTDKAPKNSLLEVKTGGTVNFTGTNPYFYVGYWSGASTSTHCLRVDGGTVNVPNVSLIAAQDSAYGYVELNDGTIAAKGMKVRGRTNDVKDYAHDERFIQRGGLLELGSEGFTAGEVKYGTPYLNLAGGTLKPTAELTLPYATYWSCFGEKESDAGAYTIDLNGQSVNWQTGLQGFSDVTITGEGSFTSSTHFQNIPKGNWKVEDATASVDLSGASGFAGGLSLGENARATIEIDGESLVEMGAFTTAEFANFDAVTNYMGSYQYLVNSMERLHRFDDSSASKIQYCFYCYRGQFYVPEDKVYYFAGTYDDYLTFEVDGEVILSNVGTIGSSWQVVSTGNRELQVGWHNFRVCAYDQTGGQGPGYSDWKGVMALGWTTKQPNVANSSYYYTKFDPSTLRMRPGVCAWQKMDVYDTTALDTPDFAGTSSGCLNSMQMLRTYNGSELRAFCPNKTTCRFTGEFFAPETGDYAFTGHFDDVISIIIDGQLVCKTTSWSETIIGTGTVTLSAGWHRFDVRVADNTGNVGYQNAVTVKAPGMDEAVPFDEGNFEMRVCGTGLGGTSLLAAGSTLSNAGAGVCPIWGTLAGSGALSGNFAFASGGTWRVGIDGAKLTDVINVDDVDNNDFVKNLRHIDVSQASRALAQRYCLCAAGSLTVLEAAEIDVTAGADLGVTDAVTEGWRAEVSDGMLWIVNPKPTGLVLFVK
ncbi:MAG: hypothetical protein J6334_05185 [Kiritimatiellae bacterium]|nr:hypothetical protein [Kiritimatiellia bacterium]